MAQLPNTGAMLDSRAGKRYVAFSHEDYAAMETGFAGREPLDETDR